MPRMTGDELFYKLIEQDFSGETIFLTAFADKNLVQKVMRMGAFDIIDKPINNDILISRLHNACNKIVSARCERKFFESVTKFFDYNSKLNYDLLDYEKRAEYLEALMAMLELKSVNKKN
ncbi:MAG: hypothetical protein BM556_10405 [Bacteriovorax sp. MedPE-SWde]|nr:MAG: hypothetical protein BM556_10405 [Bacteriovorax sp. MedPE-SWde]